MFLTIDSFSFKYILQILIQRQTETFTYSIFTTDGLQLRSYLVRSASRRAAVARNEFEFGPGLFLVPIDPLLSRL